MPEGGARPHILVVDRDAGVCETIATICETAGDPFDVSCAQTGAKAREFIRERPDVAVLDPALPDEDGFALGAHALEMTCR